MLSENVRNWLLQLELEALRTGKMPDVEMSEEEKKSFDRDLAFFKQVRDQLGEKAFSELTIDVDYDI